MSQRFTKAQLIQRFISARTAKIGKAAATQFFLSGGTAIIRRKRRKDGKYTRRVELVPGWLERERQMEKAYQEVVEILAERRR